MPRAETPRKLRCTCWNEKAHPTLGPQRFDAIRSYPGEIVQCPVCGSTNTTHAVN